MAAALLDWVTVGWTAGALTEVAVRELLMVGATAKEATEVAPTGEAKQVAAEDSARAGWVAGLGK